MSATDIGTIGSASRPFSSASLQGSTPARYSPYSPFLNRIRFMNMDPRMPTDNNKQVLGKLSSSYREILVLVTESSAPVIRTVRLYNSRDGSLMETARTGADGRATFQWLDDALSYFIVAFDDDGAPVRNAVIFDRIQGRTAPNRFINTGVNTDYTYTISNLGTTITRASGNYFDFTESSILNFNRNLTDPCGKVWFGGNMQFDNSSRFGTGAMLFNGTSTVVASPPSSEFDFGTGDFCVQFWIKTTTDHSVSAGLARIFVPDKTINQTGGLQIVIGNGSFGTVANRVSVSHLAVSVLNSSTAVNDGLWHHIAVSRQSGTLRIFFDGNQEASVTDTTNYSLWGTEGIRMGSRSDRSASSFLNASIDSIEINKGIPVYTANFTPPATEFSRSLGTAAIGFARTIDPVNRPAQKINYQFSLSSNSDARVGFTKGYVDSPLLLLGTGANSWAVTASTTATGAMISNNATIPTTPTTPQVNLTSYEYIAQSYSQSSVYGAGLTADTTNMRDNNFNTGAATNDVVNSFIAMDLGDSRNVSTIRLGSASNLTGWGAVGTYLNGRLIQYSNNNTDWTTSTTISGIGNTAATFDIQLPLPIQARYWRIIAPASNGAGFWVAATEFRAFGIQDRAVNLLVDWSNGRVWVAVNGVYTNGAANPDAGTGFDFTIPFDVPVFIAASTAAATSTVTLRVADSTWSLPNTSQFTYSATRV